MKKTTLLSIILLILMFGLLASCKDKEDPDKDDPIDEEIKGWDGEKITYLPEDIQMLNASIPQGYAIINPENDQSAIIKSLSPELDNYGGVSTGVLTLDFNYAVIFRMDVVSAYTQYIVKLFVEGESEAFYVLSDQGTPGVVSVNVVDAMLSAKYREKDTQPDPGYATGFKYDGMIKNCYFYIMPKGPDGEQRTAELVVSSISITNYKTPAITGVTLSSPLMSDGTISKLKGTEGVNLNATVVPEGVQDTAVTWMTSNPEVATVNESGFVSFVGVGEAIISAVSVIDQSKTGQVRINVLSGFENKEDLIDELNGIDFTQGRVQSSLTNFDDLYKTTWTEASIIQALRPDPVTSIAHALRIFTESSGLMIENRFNPELLGHVDEALANQVGDQAMASVELAGRNEHFGTRSAATIYRKIGGFIFKEALTASSKLTVDLTYAQVNGTTWSRPNAYDEETIVVFDDGTVTKYKIAIKNVTVIADYDATDFLNPALWADGDTLVLAPGSVRDNGDGTVTIREENPTAYPYGGIVSNLFENLEDRQMEVTIEVTGLNPERVLWNVRLIYYNNGSRVGNPLTLEASNDTGRFMLGFVPAFDQLRLYLIANGSDISEIAPGAEIKIRTLTFQYIDD
ncbi:MAG: Ig-like domain-containing protein [Acholeplasmataceae bacterium]|nr:Ig-like domain-containing protein [Acholeplasmataceae bacterium]